MTYGYMVNRSGAKTYYTDNKAWQVQDLNILLVYVGESWNRNRLPYGERLVTINFKAFDDSEDWGQPRYNLESMDIDKMEKGLRLAKRFETAYQDTWAEGRSVETRILMAMTKLRMKAVRRDGYGSEYTEIDGYDMSITW